MKSFQIIEYLRNLLEYNNSQDAHLNLQNVDNISRSTTIMNRVMDTRFELQYKTVEEL